MVPDKAVCMPIDLDWGEYLIEAKIWAGNFKQNIARQAYFVLVCGAALKCLETPGRVGGFAQIIWELLTGLTGA